MKSLLSRRESLHRIAAGASSLIAAGVFAPLVTHAQTSQTVRIVVPFPPGGSTDLLARRLAEKLTAALGRTVLVENRAGAGGTVGADHVAKSAPDGTTLLMGVTGSNAIAQSLYPNLSYNVIKDFAPLSIVVSAPLVVAVNPDVKATTLQELVALAKVRPGSLSYGSPGNGTSMHLTGEMFKQAASVSMVHIPYRGSAAVLADLMGGQIQVTFGDLLVLKPQLEAGKLRALAVTSRQRHPMLPDVPTVAESGFPGFEALSWQGLFAPAGTPEALVAQISAEVGKAMTAPDVRDFFAARGFLIDAMAPAASRAFIEAEVAKWSPIVKASGATVN